MVGYLFIVIGLALCALIGLRRLVISRSFQLFGQLVNRIDTNKKVIALTFDDGPKPVYTEKILEILDAEKIKATFFLLGHDIDEFPEQTKKIISSGHEIGNHTYSHRRMFLVTASRVVWEIEKTAALIKGAGYEKKTVFRPPFGSKFIALPWYLKKKDITDVTWDIEPETDKESAGDSDRIADYVVKRAKPGSIVLLHVMFDSRLPTMQAVPKIICRLKDKGYHFMTVSELISIQSK